MRGIDGCKFETYLNTKRNNLLIVQVLQNKLQRTASKIYFYLGINTKFSFKITICLYVFLPCVNIYVAVFFYDVIYV